MRRFWAKVTRRSVTECWPWQGARTEDGYGRFMLDGVNQRAPRVVWQLTNGPIPEGLCILHRCDNPSCVNLDHLFLGSRADNNADRAAKGRSGHPTLPPGDQNPQAKLRGELVRRMRSESKAGVGVTILAGRYGVSRSQVYRILSGKNWGTV